CYEAGLADTAREGEDGEDRRASFLLTHGCCLGQLLAGLLEDAFESKPARGYALAGMLKSVGHGRRRRRWRRDDRLRLNRRNGRRIEPRGTRRRGIRCMLRRASGG